MAVWYFYEIVFILERRKKVCFVIKKKKNKKKICAGIFGVSFWKVSEGLRSLQVAWKMRERETEKRARPLQIGKWQV